jgi:ubiquinone/menaquinone biosynthesis C-methylase UbiE
MAKDDIVAGFRGVDQTTDPASFVHFLETVSAMDAIQVLKRRTFALLEVKPGQHLLDIGCGLGDEARALAHLVGSTGQVIGVDSSETMITEARNRTTEKNLPVQYAVGDIHALDFADNTFDGCRAERILGHVANPRQALAELRRVAKSGARIVALDPELETLVLDVEDRTTTRKILHFYCDSARNVWIARQYRRLFHEARLTDIAVFADTILFTSYAEADRIFRLQDTAKRAQAAGVVSEAEGTAWLEELDRANQAGRFFAALTFFFVSGRKP